ncbi:MAG TPA: PIN domain-containing protein [Polyangiaceae bacterium]|nr:PIN domain-containing protein [Polyangiaceae bacterium]
MIARYVFDTGALIAAERGKERAARFLRLVTIGRARILVPLPVIADWWRGRTGAREEILASTQVVASLEAVKAAGIALGRMRNVDAKLTIDAIVMATAALTHAIVVTGDVRDFDALASHFVGVPVLGA